MVAIKRLGEDEMTYYGVPSNHTRMSLGQLTKGLNATATLHCTRVNELKQGPEHISMLLQLRSCDLAICVESSEGSRQNFNAPPTCHIAIIISLSYMFVVGILHHAS